MGRRHGKKHMVVLRQHLGKLDTPVQKDRHSDIACVSEQLGRYVI